MADKLTPQQRQAVYDRGGKLLVSAAAGSGKTKVLVDRLLTYLTDEMDPANLDEFLIITYTKAAASELRGKIAAKLTERIAKEPENRHLQKQMQRLFLTKISTVHGFCGDLLREYAYRLDLPADFRVADENECRELRENVLKDLLDRAYAQEDNGDFYAFVDTQGLGRDDRLIPQIIEQVYDSARCHLDPQGWLEGCLAASDVQEISDASETLWGKYLLEDLWQYLDCQIRVMETCVSDMERSGGLEKQILNYQETLQQLRQLRSAETWDDTVKNSNLTYSRLVFPKKDVDLELIDRVKAARKACKEGMEKKLQSFTDDSAQILRDLQQSAAGIRGLVTLVHQFEQDYYALKRSRRVLDFSDLEHKTLELLLGRSRSGPTAAATEIGRRYREILVDEYQDSNGVQDAIFDALTREKQNCFLVGDVKQSIYQFRLADPGIFLQKYHNYVPAEEASPRQGRKVLLSHNFRSGPEIIEAVNQVFCTCMHPETGGLYYGEAEALHEGIPHSALPDPAVELHTIEVQKEAYPEEAAFVAERIDTMLRNGTLVRDGEDFRPVEPEDIVILLRSPGSAGRYFQQALEARGIRCTTGGSTNLLQTEEIRTLRSFLQAIVNPRLDIPLLSVLASPLFGFTANDLAAFRAGKKKMPLYDALLESDSLKAVHFLSVLSQLRRDARMNTLTCLLERCYHLTRLDSIYGSMPGGEARRGNLQAFYKIAADFENGALRDLNQFLDHLTAMEESGLVVSGAAPSGCVTIMSIHKSKGLEFPVVFLSNLSRVFNQESSRAQVLCDKELGLGLSIADPVNRVRYPSIAKRAIGVKMRAESVSEEVRVLYVAMTRARDRLIMTYAQKNPESNLQQKTQRYDFDNGELLCRSAVCLGDWVVLEAMQHREAGDLHATGGRPGETRLGMYPWKMTVGRAPAVLEESAVQEEESLTVSLEIQNRLKEALSVQYAHLSATTAPSKQTATDRKGRQKDDEAAEGTQTPKNTVRTWRQPTFLSQQPQGRAYGNAIHHVMQYICYENCGTEVQIRQEVERLVRQGFLKGDEADLVNISKIAAFFASEIGTKLRKGVAHLREFKFSILDDACHYGDGLEGEKVLLQGVVDCALLEADGITVVDFKTDAVTEDSLAYAVERYRPQIQTYGEALRRIYEMPVKAQYLYFFRLNRFVKI